MSSSDLLPPHTAAERDALKSDIEAHGLLVPIVVDEKQKIIDGRLRAELCKELGVDWRSKAADIRVGLSEIEKQALRIRLNILRRSRPPTSSQRRAYREIFLKAHPELGDLAIANLTGDSRPTIQRVRASLVATGKIKKPLATVGVDGKKRAVKKTSRRVITSGKRQLNDVLQDLEDYQKAFGELPPTLSSFQRIHKQGNAARRKIRRTGEPRLPLPKDVRLECCDFRKLAVKPHSVDLILTDVLWYKSAIPDWVEVAKLSQTWLKPKGIFASWIGTYYLAEFIRQMTVAGLFYQWTFPVVFRPNGQSKHEVNGVTALWRPVVAFSVANGHHDFGGCLDVFRAEGLPEKDWHRYQQPLQPCADLVDQLSLPGNLVCDPFFGSGTTALACLTAKSGPRRFVGCDRDPEAWQAARMRIDKFLRDKAA